MRLRRRSLSATMALDNARALQQLSNLNQMQIELGDYFIRVGEYMLTSLLAKPVPFLLVGGEADGQTVLVSAVCPECLSPHNYALEAPNGEVYWMDVEMHVGTQVDEDELEELISETE